MIESYDMWHAVCVSVEQPEVSDMRVWVSNILLYNLINIMKPTCTGFCFSLTLPMLSTTAMLNVRDMSSVY